MGSRNNKELYKWIHIIYGQVDTELDSFVAAYSVVELGGALYCGDESSNLYKMNTITNKWDLVAPSPAGGAMILCVHSGKIYGVRRRVYNLKLWEWNGVDAWVSVAPAIALDYYDSIISYDGNLYIGTYFPSATGGGKLYMWNGVDDWVLKATQLNSQYMIPSLYEFDGKLYGGTSPGAKLFEWNDADAWVEVADTYSGSTIADMNEYDGRLFATSGVNLLEWNGVAAWIDRGLSNARHIFPIDNGTPYGWMMYGVEYLTQIVHEFDMEGNVRKLKQDFDWERISIDAYPSSMFVYDSTLYIGDMTLYEYDEGNVRAIVVDDPLVIDSYVQTGQSPKSPIVWMTEYNSTLYFITSESAHFGMLYGGQLHHICDVGIQPGTQVTTGKFLLFFEDEPYAIFAHVVGLSVILRIWKLNTGDSSFTQMTQPAPEHNINTIAVYDSKLYAAGDNGILYEWSGSSWVEKAPQLNSRKINYLYEFNGKLYGGCGTTSGYGCLHEWNDADAWVEVAPAFNDGSYTGANIQALMEYSGELYAICVPSGGYHWLLKWNGLDAWTKIGNCEKYANQAHQMAVFNSKLWWGTRPAGVGPYIYSYDGVSINYEMWWSCIGTIPYAYCQFNFGGSFYISSDKGMLMRLEFPDIHRHTRPTMNEMPGYRPAQHGGAVDMPYERTAERDVSYDWLFKLTENWDNAEEQLTRYRMAGDLLIYANNVSVAYASFISVGEGWYKANIPAANMGDPSVVLRAVLDDTALAEEVVCTYTL
jgi:hypothetical protein